MSRPNGIEAQFTRLAYHFARQYLFWSSFKIMAKALSNVLQIAVCFWLSIAICNDGLI
jgi:hypothetical protein